jgi:hypothetical protein
VCHKAQYQSSNNSAFFIQAIQLQVSIRIGFTAFVHAVNGVVQRVPHRVDTTILAFFFFKLDELPLIQLLLCAYDA